MRDIIKILGIIFSMTIVSISCKMKVSGQEYPTVIKWHIEPQYFSVSNFSEGLAGVNINNKFGYIDKTNNLIIPAKFDGISAFKNGVAQVQIKKHSINPFKNEIETFCIDKNGKKTNTEYIDNKDVESNNLHLYFDDANKRFGYKNGANEIIIKPIFAQAMEFSEGLAGVQITDYYGFINEKGEIVIPAVFELVGRFSEGVAWVKYNNKCGFICKP